ncbi:restriction endonuclease S subunit [Clostridium putrefaciens]|uniref:Restriction endonuclease S subunit n=1 Tax=Clostridium putrefaciens TaxID=99675 RepID=A0A381J5G6_9CLOT|nr:restriction endonuclease subunit S [Clostridium putrefaciens]SUY45985.1 restriction endonuclease S subunit [Clostridium putrefaciens]
MNKEIAKRINLIKQGKVPEGYKNSDVGIIPKEWGIKKLTEYITSLSNGTSVNAGDRSIKNGEIGVLKTSSITINGFKPEENKLVTNGSDIKNLKVYPQKDNLVIVRKNTPELVGMVNYIDKDYENIFLPDLLWQTVFKEDCYINKKYIYYFLNTNYYNKLIKTLATGSSKSMPNIRKENFLNILISIPSNKEQNKISMVLSTLDKLIKLKQKLLQEKQKHKKGLMERLLTGKVRLKGFERKWNKIKISQILKVRNYKSEVTEDLELYSLTIEDGVTPKSDRYNREFLVKEDNKKYKITKYNDIVYNPANLRFGAIALNKIQKDVLVSPIYETLYIKDNKKHDIDFISAILTSYIQIKRFSTMAEGTLVERMAVKIKDFINFSIKIPNDLNEGKEIAKILNTADKEINLLKEEIEALKQQKKGLMQLILTGIVRVNDKER